jgi:hypothetical protein
MNKDSAPICRVCGLDDGVDEKSFRSRRARWASHHTPVTPEELAEAGKDVCYNCKVIHEGLVVLYENTDGASAGRLCTISYVEGTDRAAPLGVSVVSAQQAADAGTGTDQIEYYTADCKSTYRSVIMP